MHKNPFLESNDPVAVANYTKLNEKIEWASGWYYFLLVKFSSLGCMIPAVFLTIVNYTIYDMGDESYFLPLPIAYVSQTYPPKNKDLKSKLT